MDGVKLYIEQSPEAITQNNFYNGWTHDHYVGNLLGFCPDGTIPMALVNVPGCIHDYVMAQQGNIYGKLENVFNSCDRKCAFCRGNNEYFIKSSQTLSNDPESIIINSEVSSLRQSAE